MTILDDGPQPVVNITAAPGDAPEGYAAFHVSFSRPSDLPVAVHWSTQDGTAHEGEDFAGEDNVLVFAAGQTERTILVPLAGLGTHAEDRAFQLVITGVEHATVSVSSATGIVPGQTG